MRKMLIGTLLVVIAAVISCEIPQSITIKGSPEVYIPLGKLSSLFDEGEGITDFVSAAKIREMMGGTSGMSLYDYRGPAVDSGVQAFLIHYPITEMTLDLSKYLNEAMDNDDTDYSFTIPDLSAEYPAFAGNLGALFQPGGTFEDGCFINANRLSATEGSPLFIISLGDMATLLKSVKGGAGAFGLKLSNYDPSFDAALKVKIPALGITDYISGTKNGNNLVFANAAEFTFFPQTVEDHELKIYFKFDAPCSGTIAPEMIIDWEEATVDTSEIGGMTGDYEIENILGEFLGGGVGFKDVRGYIYIGGGIGEKASMSLGLGSSQLLNDESLHDVERPSFSDPFTGNIPSHSLATPAPISLKEALNAQEASTLAYDIHIDEMILEAEDVDEDVVIFADLVILLTLEFEVRNIPSSTVPNGYVKLDFGNVFPEPEEGKDIFMRKGNDEDLLNNLDTVKIVLSDIDNNIFQLDKLSILVINTGSEAYSGYLHFSDTNPSLTIDMHELPFPFSPKFEILLKKDDGQDYATLKILRNSAPVFDFFLAAIAKASINETIEF
ncbi:MAG: hypothetical protein LBQ89_04855 [Treponema sp.]|jgi:hypothetical protein|nr:hypothetical protein [Treponema sp.]